MTEDKKILIVIAFNGFQDEEYFVPKEVLEKASFIVETTSTQEGMAKGVEGGEAIINIKVDKIQIEDYKAIIFCGGSGMIEELNNEIFLKLAKDFYEEKKLIGAICVAPALLAKSGILVNKQATVWSSSLNKDYIKVLEEHGATYKDDSVVISENIITANGPEAVRDFGQRIVNLLNK
jgi:protease I